MRVERDGVMQATLDADILVPASDRDDATLDALAGMEVIVIAKDTKLGRLIANVLDLGGTPTDAAEGSETDG